MLSIKQWFRSIPVPNKLRLVYHRITVSRLTTIYFLFSVIHFVVQLSFQSKAFSVNSHGAHLLNNLVLQHNATNGFLPFLSGSTLRMCGWVPSNLNVEACMVIWNGTANTDLSGNIRLDSDLASPTMYSSVATTSSLLPTSSLPPTSSPLSTSSLSITSPIPATSASSTKSTIPKFTSSARLSANTIVSTLPASTFSSAITTSSGATTPSNVQNTPATVTVFVGPKFPGLHAASDNDIDDGDEEEDDVGDRIDNNSALKKILQNKSNSKRADDDDGSDLSTTCLWALNYPVSVLHDTEREDLVFIGFQFWVLGMSIVAILNESIPHIFASLLTHLMATAWAGYQIFHTNEFRSDFRRVITNGACKGANFLPGYWDARSKAEIASLVLNIASLFVSCLLTWRLMKLYGWQTFKRVGASLTINRIYKIVLILSITIQLSLFFMAVTVSLWIDQLMNSVIGDLVDYLTLYKVSSFITLILLTPWLMMGWFASRRELRVPMFFFLVLSILYLGAWGVMFFSTTFRWTFMTWQFFSIMACTSVFLTCLSFTLGIVCRLNFGKGMARYLSAHQPLLDNEFSPSSDMEKVAFPTNEKLPTFSVAFDSKSDVPYTTQLSSQAFSNYNQTGRPNSLAFNIVPPPLAKTKNPMLEGTPQHVYRSDSYGSQRSFDSGMSTDGHTRSNSQMSQPRRWVIE